ncbi:MAG: hypothetical protein OXG76_07660 [Acidimicrobiaceae bacterium]|nr:hypothetical protein [Acidimicrobiaceae bacterium]
MPAGATAQAGGAATNEAMGLATGAAARAGGAATDATTSPAADEAAARSVLVIVRGSSAVDAAVASSLVAAGLGDAVVFAESADALGADNAAIVGEERPAGVLLIGGTAALSAQLEAEVRRLVDDVEIDRIAGADRVDTAALAAELVLARNAIQSRASTSATAQRDPGEPERPIVVLANAWSPQDVGTAAAAVIAGGADVMLYAADGWLGSRTAGVLRTHQPGRLVIAGTPEAFTHEMVASALLAAESSTPPARLDGSDGAAASAQAAQLAAPADIHAAGLVDIPDVFDVAVIAHGERPQDVSAALALGAAINRSAVLLTHDAQLADGAETLLLEHQPPHIVIVDQADAASGTDVGSGAFDSAGGDSSASADADAQHSGLAELLAPALGQIAPAAAVSTVSTLAGSTRRALEGIPVADRSVRLGFVSVSVGHDHVCGLRGNGTIACWGAGVGIGSTVAGGKARSPSGTYRAVTAGGTFSCALLSDSTLDCWGSKDQWQVYTPDGRFAEITAGWGHACARFADNSVNCWGDQWGAEFLIPSGAPFLALSAGRHHTCGLEPSLNITCWGKAGDGQLTAPDGVFVAVAAGETHSCGLEPKGALECWGGRTGDGGRAASTAGNVAGNLVPDEYAARRYVGVSAGSGFTCALRPAQLIDCWDINGGDASSIDGGNGDGTDDNLDLGIAPRIENVPRGLYTAVSAGGTFACALRTNTSVVCWGSSPFAVWDPFAAPATGQIRQ